MPQPRGRDTLSVPITPVPTPLPQSLFLLSTPSLLFLVSSPPSLPPILSLPGSALPFQGEDPARHRWTERPPGIEQPRTKPETPIQ